MDVVAVVPIFMSAGAALLPTLLAGVTSVAAVLFDPRELLRICRRTADRGCGSVAGVVIAASIGIWLLLGDSPAQAAKAAAAARRLNTIGRRWLRTSSCKENIPIRAERRR